MRTRKTWVDFGCIHWGLDFLLHIAGLLFMWQLDIVGVAHFVMDCFDYLDAASSSNQP